MNLLKLPESAQEQLMALPHAERRKFPGRRLRGIVALKAGRRGWISLSDCARRCEVRSG